MHRLPPNNLIGAFGAHVFLMSLLIACDPQAANGYPGEPLFALHGSVDLSGVTLNGPFVPVLLFASGESDHMTLASVDFRGVFPSAFTLHAYEPPPDEHFMQLSWGDEPRVAVAFIAIVPWDHPTDLSGFGWQGVRDGVACERPGPCEVKYEWCTPAYECRSQTYSCPTVEDWHRTRLGDYSACELVRNEGEPRPGDDIFSVVAGFAHSYKLVYLEHAASAHTWTSGIAGWEALPAGYSLIKTDLFLETEEQRQTREACEQRAPVLAAERYNAMHGTSFTVEELGDSCWAQPIDCSDASEEFQELTWRAIAELGCPGMGTSNQRIADPETEMIRLRIDPHAPVVSQAHP